MKQSLFLWWRCAQDCRVADAPRNDERKKDAPCNDGRKSVQFGRSMVEMLGVLAIIGVLSVGGITGYTKAMQMYNSNLQRQQISELIAGMLQIQTTLNFKDNYTNITSAFDALNIIPHGLSYKDNKLYDKFGNNITILYGDTRYDLQFSLALDSEKTLTAIAFDYCLNVLQIAKENSSILHYVNLYQTAESTSFTYQGKRTCSKNNNCLKDISTVQMHQACKFCSKQSNCFIYIHLWP